MESVAIIWVRFIVKKKIDLRTLVFTRVRVNLRTPVFFFKLQIEYRIQRLILDCTTVYVDS
jgi:hypothetical protein